MSAIEYDFMSSLINNKKQEIEQKNEIKGIPPLPSVSAFSGSNNMFALGGDYQTNGSDFTTGMTHIDAGGSHEENPNEGVQMGVDREGTPNLVEEGETVFNDYVYSNRIELDDKAKEAFHVSKKQKITYSDFSKKLEKESIERPNDPISQAGLKAQLEDLAEHQERQKQEMEEKRAQEAFDALTPDEQAGLMQYAQEQKQAEQEAVQEQAAQEQMMQQMSPEEQAMMQQQMADGSTPNLGAEPQMSAYGGRVNRFDDGGIKQGLYSLLGLKTQDDWNAWAEQNNFNDLINFEDWDNILKNQAFVNAVTKNNPALADAISRGYDFGQYKAPSSKYDLEAFRKVLSEYTKSKRQGNTKGMYAIDRDFGLGNYKTIKELEDSPEYKAYTQYLTDMLNRAKGIQWRRKDANKTGVYDNMEFKDGKSLTKEDYDALYTLARTVQGTSTKDEGDPVPIFDYDEDGDGWYGLRDDVLDTVLRLRGDQKGGIFHLNPTAVKRGTQANNYVINDDGTIEALKGNTDGFTLDNTYRWADAQTDYTNNYYRRSGNNPKTYHAVVGDEDHHLENELDWSKVGDEVRRETLPNGDTVIYHAGKGPGADETVKPGTAGDARKIVPVHKNENLRYAGLFGPAVGLGMQALGLGKPDTSKLDASLKMANDLAFAKPYLIGDYMKYNPLDRLFYSNQLQANSRATDRGIMNTSGGNRGAAMAGLIANGYNTNNNLGNLYRQAEEYNRGQYERTKEFNRGTNQFNAQTLTQNSQFNADAYNRNRQFAAQMAANVANQKMDADAGWWNGIYGNIGGLFKGIGDLGRENYQHNRIADMAATGIFGTMKPETFVSNGFLRYEDEDPTWLNKRARGRAKGGKINRKKGGK